MNILTTTAAVRDTIARARKAGLRIAFVPTMGNLHEGHITLIREARKKATFVIASIFVNPTQFGPGEDFDQYPRTLESDRAQLEAVDCDALFLPDTSTLYPNGAHDLTTVHVPVVSEGLCAERRPGHFDGVATVVSILFNIVMPDIALFGKKDYQQLSIIKKMTSDLHLPIEIIGVDTVRESSGLARSSRNGYLNKDQHVLAALLYRQLQATSERLKKAIPIDIAIAEAKEQLKHDGFEVDYLELRQPDLTPLTHDTREAVLLVAVFLGTTRLIDNICVTLTASNA